MSDIRQHNRPLWLIAQAFINVLHNLFGAPEAIAAEHTLARDQWKLMAKWLRAGEALMRHLLLIEAAALPAPAPSKPRASRRPRTRKLMTFAPDKPEDWRVSFRCFMDRNMDRRRPRRHASALAGETPALQRFHSAWPLAERAEALLRVFNDPLPYAQRIARRLASEPARARTLTRHPDDAPSLVGADDFAQIAAQADRALLRYESG